MLFNIYYINYPKVYEIKMMLNNLVSLNKSIEKNKAGEMGSDIGASFGLGFLKLFKGDAKVGVEAKGSISNKVIETLEVKTTKSIILSEVFEKSSSFLICSGKDRSHGMPINGARSGGWHPFLCTGPHMELILLNR